MSYRIIRKVGTLLPVRLQVPHLRRFGVPPGGPFDRESAEIALVLAEQDSASEVMECSGELEIESESDGSLVWAGSVHRVGSRHPSGYPSVQAMIRGERIVLRGFRYYIAWSEERITLRASFQPSSMLRDVIRVVAGPDRQMLHTEGLYLNPYIVLPTSSRVGVRLHGPGMPNDCHLTSEPQVPGVIQVPPSGQPIILGPDGPTIGGYPKVAVVIRADMDKIGQLAAGDEVRFVEVSLCDAEALYIDQEELKHKRLEVLKIGQKAHRDELSDS